MLTALDQNTLKAAMLSTPKTIFVFEGGGAKGLVYAGALKIAEKNGLKAQKVAGSSAGGITAFLLATGHNAAQIEQIMMELDLTQLQDSKPLVNAVNCTANAVNETAKVMVPVYGLARYMIDAQIPLQMGDAAGVVGSMVDTCFLSGTAKGVWQGEFFLAKAREFLKAKTGREKMTFQELHELKESQPELGLIDLYLTGTDADTGESVVFSHENPETKDVDIVDALRATMSFPFAFKPHEITINGKLRRFIDGGVKNNYPMNIFDIIGEDGTRRPNPQVLGFKVDDKEECETLLFKDDIPNKEKRIGKFTALSQDGDVYQYYRYNTVQIYDADVWTLDFDLDPLTKFILKQSGEESMKAFIKDGYQSKPMDDNELVNTLMKIGKDLNNGNYLDVQQGLMFLNGKYPEVAPQVASIVIGLMQNFKTVGLKPGATEAYAALIKEAYTIAQVTPQSENRVLGALKGGTFAAAGFGVPLLLGGALNPFTAPIVAAAAVGGIIYGAVSKGERKPSVVDLPFSKETVKGLISNYNYKQAYDFIIANKSALTSLEDIVELHEHIKSMRTKGFWNQTRVDYDTLYNYLVVQRRLLTPVEPDSVDELVESFTDLKMSRG